MKRLKTVNEYIASAPADVSRELKELYSAIQNAIPKATARISYGMPYFDYNGRLVYFANFKDHISVFIPTPVIEEHAQELQRFSTSKGTIRFPLSEELPIDLIVKLVKIRARKNDEKLKDKNTRKI